MSGRSNAILIDAPSEAEERQEKEIRENRSAGAILAAQLTDAASIILIAAAALSAITGSAADSLPIIIMVILNTLAGYIGEYRCEKALRRIAEVSSERAEKAAAEFKPCSSPLDEEIDRAGRILSFLTLGGCLIYFAASLIHGRAVTESFYFSAALAIAAIPQGIGSVYTVMRGAAMSRAFRRGAAVFSPAAFEKLARAGMLIIGKSGIITEERLSVSALLVMTPQGFKEYEYSEADSRLTSGGSSDGFRAWEDPALSRTLICAAVCNQAKKVTANSVRVGRNRGKSSFYEGDAADAALLRLCSACGIERDLLICRKISELPFDGNKKYMMVTVAEQYGKSVTYAKGAPEEISALCCLPESTLTLEETMCRKYGTAGMKLIAFAMNNGSGWQFLGLAAFKDPVRHGCAETVRRLRRMGTGVMLVTGDHSATAAGAARRAGILPPEAIAFEGGELEKLDDERLSEYIRRISLVSRAQEKDTERLVDALHGRGVAAVQLAAGKNSSSADVKLSLTDNSADILLSGDGLAQTADLICGSRRMFYGIRNTVCCMTACCVMILVTAVVPALTGMPAALDSSRMLLSSLLCVSLPMLLSTRTDRREKPLPPERCEGSCFEGGVLADAAVRGGLCAVSVLACFMILLMSGYDNAAASSCAVLTLILSQTLTAAEYPPAVNLASLSALINALLPLIIFIFIIFFSPLSKIFSLIPPDLTSALISTALSAAVPAIITLSRAVWRKRK